MDIRFDPAFLYFIFRARSHRIFWIAIFIRRVLPNTL